MTLSLFSLYPLLLQTDVTVTRIDGELFPADTRALPTSAGLKVTLSASRVSCSVVLTGASRHVVLQFGSTPSKENSSSFRHAMIIFVGGRDPVVSQAPSSTAVVFKPGVHRIGDDGVFQLPAGVDTIVLQRGAVVQGRINITRGVGPVSVLGHGLFDGSVFKYHGSAPADNMRSIEPQFDRPLLWDGVTIINPKGHAAFAPPGSRFRNFRMLGWLYNEDGIWIGTNCTLSDSFIRTNDDSIRIYGGELDDYHNTPGPVRGTPSVDAHVENVVVSQLFNGAVVQLGWESAGAINSSVTGLDVVGAEWYWPEPDTANTSTDRPNNAVVSLRPPVYDLTYPEHHRNITIANVRIDCGLGRVIGIGLLGTTRPCSSVEGVSMRNITVRHPLRWLRTNASAPAPKGGNFVGAAGGDTVSSVHFHGVTVAGQLIERSDDLAWNLETVGSGVSDVTYAR